MSEAHDEAHDQGRDGANPGTCSDDGWMRHDAAQRGCVVGIAVLCAALCISGYDDGMTPGNEYGRARQNGHV